MVKRKTKRRPRVQVTLPDDVYATVTRVSELSGQARAAVISEMMEVAMPALTQIMRALEIVKEQPLEAERIMNRLAAAALVDLGQSQLDLNDKLHANTVRGKRVRRAARAASEM